MSETNEVNPLATNDVTMSSLEIAKLTGKEHRNVLRDVKRILSEAEINALNFERIYTDG